MVQIQPERKKNHQKKKQHQELPDVFNDGLKIC